MKILNIILFIILLGLGGYVGFQLYIDKTYELHDASPEIEEVDMVEGVEVPKETQDVQYRNDKASAQSFKIMIESGEEEVFRDYVKSLAEFLPDEKEVEFNMKIEVLTEDQWKDLYSSSMNVVEDLSGDMEFFFIETESIKESDRYDEIPGVRYYEVIIEEDAETDYQGGYVMLYVDDERMTKFVPAIVFHRLIR